MQKAWILVLGSLACGKTDEPAPKKDPAPAVATQSFGAPVGDQAGVPLADVAAAPDKFKAQPFVATGTVGSVCQHRGCWMTLTDDHGEAFIRMAGHAFMIPKDAAGKKARVLATLKSGGDEPTCSEGAGHGGCKAEAEEQSGKPLAKLELEARGVELF